MNGSGGSIVDASVPSPERDGARGGASGSTPASGGASGSATASGGAPPLIDASDHRMPDATSRDSGSSVEAGPCTPLALKLLTADLDSPVYAIAPPGDHRIFALERATGHVVIVTDAGAQPTPFLDISSRIDNAGFEAGLLSLAFAPDFATSGAFYVSYTNATALRVSRFTVPAATPNVADPASEAVVIDLDQTSRHNQGGMITFYQGLLYIALGDDDVQARAQDLGSLSGKMLRLAVDSSKGGYTIPNGNPFAAMSGARPEIWARGLREPFRFSFDAPSGELFIGDVGDATQEELDVLPAAASSGDNFGWPIMEGVLCHTPATGCTKSGLVLPVYNYPHDGETAIIGGTVYRGKALPACYRGRYFFGNYASGVVKSMPLDNAAGVETEPGLVLPNMVSLGVDGQGELLVVGYDHPLYRVVTAP